ncbi:MAG: thymidine phosphorylase [Myxococcales bacterium]
MRTVDLIQKKRDGRPLATAEIEHLIAAYTRGDVPDYQMAALAMAIFFRGLDASELTAWTRAMLHSGSILDWSALGRPCVDKHSTGGVGDKISLPLAPAVVACGAAVPMVSGRGLGHTGGTLDKLESIPGFRVRLSLEETRRVMGDVGAVLIGQTDEIAPADRKLYSLRDATATVESIPLIASSIMSKKLAEGVQGLVLDVKTGSGAFMRTRERAKELARTLVDIGNGVGTRTVARITRMDRPLGRLIGNALEVVESVETLRGEGPDDVTTLVEVLGGEMLVLAGVTQDPEDGRARIARSLRDGTALEVFRRLVEAQGGDPRAIDDTSHLPAAAERVVVRAERAGFVQAIDTAELGRAGMVLGAGRARSEDSIDPAVGMRVLATVGDTVSAGDALVELHVNDAAHLRWAIDGVLRAYTLADTPPDPVELLLERVA